MAEVWLVCEGDSDVPVLDAVLTRVLAADILVRDGGGCDTIPSAAEYMARHHPGVTVAYVVDRDYCRRDVADATFSDGRRRFMWRRHSIEAYLLAPAVIAETFRRLQTEMSDVPGRGPAWVHALPVDEGVIAAGLRACATMRAPEEAARIAMYRLWEDLSATAGQVQRRHPKVPTASTPDAAVCRQALLDEAARLVTKAQEASTSPHLTPSSVGGRYDAEHARVSAADYMSELRFLEEFHSRDLLNAFHEWLRREHNSRLDRKRLVRELGESVPIVYQRNRSVYGTDDFLDLANGVRALAGLPPIR